MPATTVRFDQIRSLPFGSISGTYTSLGGPTAHLMRMMKIVNNSNADITLSFDAVNDNDYIPANSFALYDFETNTDASFEFYLALGTQIYIKGSPSSGSVYAILI